MPFPLRGSSFSNEVDYVLPNSLNRKQWLRVNGARMSVQVVHDCSIRFFAIFRYFFIFSIPITEDAP